MERNLPQKKKALDFLFTPFLELQRNLFLLTHRRRSENILVKDLGRSLIHFHALEEIFCLMSGGCLTVYA